MLVNIFMPRELLAGMHVEPMFPEVVSTYVGNTACSGCFADVAEGNNVPESFCSYHKIMIGMAECGVLPAPALIANTTLACDANQVLFRRLAEFYGVPQFVVDVPRSQSEASVDFVEARLYELIAVMEDELRPPLRPGGVRRDLCAFEPHVGDAGGDPSPARVGEPVYLHDRRAHGADRHAPHAGDEGGRGLRELAAAGGAEAQLVQASQSASAGDTSRKPRIFWMHTLPNWQHALRDILDGPLARCELVGKDIDFDSPMPIDMDDPVRSLARRIVENHFNGPGRRRVEATLAMAKEARADGVVVFCHWGCKQTLGISQLAKRTFEEAGLPTLVLDGDGCDERNVADGQMVTRLNAFLEQLEGRIRG